MGKRLKDKQERGKIMGAIRAKRSEMQKIAESLQYIKQYSDRMVNQLKKLETDIIKLEEELKSYIRLLDKPKQDSDKKKEPRERPREERREKPKEERPKSEEKSPAEPKTDPSKGDQKYVSRSAKKGLVYDFAVEGDKSSLFFDDGTSIRWHDTKNGPQIVLSLDSSLKETPLRESSYPWINDVYNASNPNPDWAKSADAVGGGGITYDNAWTYSPVTGANYWKKELVYVQKASKHWINPPNKKYPIVWTLVRQAIPSDPPWGGPRKGIGIDGAHLSRFYRSVSYLARVGNDAAKYILADIVDEIVARWGLNTEPGHLAYREEHLTNPSISPWWYRRPIEDRCGREWFHSVNCLRLAKEAGLEIPTIWFERLAEIPIAADKYTRNGIVHIVLPGTSHPPAEAAKAAGIKGPVARGWEQQLAMVAMRTGSWGSKTTQIANIFRKAITTLSVVNGIPQDVISVHDPTVGTLGTGITSLYARSLGIKLWHPTGNKGQFLNYVKNGSASGGPLPLDDWHPMDWFTEEVI